MWAGGTRVVPLGVLESVLKRFACSESSFHQKPLARWCAGWGWRHQQAV